MALKYYLIPYALQAQKRVYKAIPKATQKIKHGELLERMADRGSTVTYVDAIACIELYHQIILDELLEGNSVQTPLFQLNMTIEGLFDGPQDQLDFNRHQFKVSMNPSRLLRKSLKRLRPKKIQQAPQVAQFVQLHSLDKKEAISAFAPGEILSFCGYRFYVHSESDDQGLYLRLEDNSEIKIHCFRVLPSTLEFRIPENIHAQNVFFVFRGCSRKGIPQADVYSKRYTLLNMSAAL